MVTSRTLAYQVLLHLEHKASHPDRLIRTALERHSQLDERDRALLTELVYGVVRWQGRLDWHLDQLSRTRPDRIDPAVRVLIRLALYQILFLDRIPNHAAVNDSVDIAKTSQPPHVIKFINAILREAARRSGAVGPPADLPADPGIRQGGGAVGPPAELPADPGIRPGGGLVSRESCAGGGEWNYPDPRKDPAAHTAVMTSHPIWLVLKLFDQIGPEETKLFCESNNRIAPAVFRVNALKASRGRVAESLSAEGVDTAPSPWLDDALRVFSPRRDMTRTQAYREGWIQAQDEASQLVSLLLAPMPGERVLDLCSGFGVKATHIAALMKNEGEVLSVDKSAWKLEELQRNAKRQGAAIIRTLAEEIQSLQPQSMGLFDRVLVDAPCSGLGTIRRKPDIKWRSHIKDPYRLSRIQKDLLSHATRFLKPNGVLVYATCAILTDENELVALHLSESHPELGIEPAAENLPGACREMVSGPYFRSWPQKHDMDGFFAARWRKNTSEKSPGE
jgi:16S rRNA (cytosine967-C5)-methyltransferase